MPDTSKNRPRPTFPVVFDQFQLSPFFEKYRTETLIMGGYAGRFYTANWGADVETAYKALRQKSVLYDVPERPVEITGPDTVALLEKVFSRPVGTLRQGKARYAIACHEDGGILMDGILMCLAPDHYWYVKADGEFDVWLKAHAIGLDVTIRDPDSWVLQIQGPTSLAAMEAATNGSLTGDLGYFNHGWFDIGGQRLLVSRTGWTGELGYEIYTQGDDTDAHALWDLLLQAGEPHGLIAASVDSMNIRRVEAGILNNISDMDDTMTPYDAGLGAFVDLDKEGFIGRDALVSASKETRLFGIRTLSEPDGALEDYIDISGADVYQGNECIGRTTIGVVSPYLDCAVGYVHTHVAGDWNGKQVEVRSADGQSRPAMICSLPFYDPEKRIPRGLDDTIPEF